MTRLSTLFGPDGQTWSRGLDFVGPRPVTAWWAWGVLGLGGLACLFTFDALDKTRIEHDSALAQVRRLERADRRVGLAQAIAAKSAQETGATQSASGSAPVLSGRGLAEAANVGLLMGYPWGQALADLEAQAANRQAVLMGASVSLENVAERSRAEATWRVQAAVRDDAAALDWVAQLPDGQLLSRERLSQPFEGLAGHYEFKVNAQMQWPGSVMSPSHQKPKS